MLKLPKNRSWKNLSASTETRFAEVLLPVPIDQSFTYRIPRALEDSISTGIAVVVPFGKRKILTGIVSSVHANPPKDHEARYIEFTFSELPLVNTMQLTFFQWIARYYMAPIGDVIQAAIPSAFKLSSQSRIALRPDFDLHESTYPFQDQELRLLEQLEYQENMTYEECMDLLGIKTIQPVIKSLRDKGAIYLYEEIKEKYKPKTVTRVRLQKKALEEKTLQDWFTELEKKQKQQELLIIYCQLTGVIQNASANEKGALKTDLLEKASPSSLKTLIRNGLFEEFSEIVSRIEYTKSSPVADIVLSKLQEQKRDEILQHFNSKDIVLLHGITGSGKTSIYIDLIKKSLENGGQVLYLLPEIALTTQITRRLRAVFGDKLGIYHSKFSDAERAELWMGLQNGSIEIVLGVRSSIFLPFSDLNLIIIDEEHDPSYKQYDPSPRYQARDAAIVLANIHHAKVILGTATPAMESYYLAEHGVYGRVELMERYGNARPPLVELASLKGLKGPGSEFSTTFIERIGEALAKKEQVIIFQNRRGYAHYITCEVCGWVPESPECNVKLTYHQYKNELRCHYTGYREKMPELCPVCGSKSFKMIGFGTEQVEEGIRLRFPDAIIQRMDLDTTKSKYAFQHIIESFENRETDILVGTQMVTKGLDFDHVTLVGIFDADRMMYFPDFRAHERTFQLLMQVSGRAGRSDKKGRVIIQTHQPEHMLFQRVINQDYKTQYEVEIEERKRYGFPPFTRLVKIVFKHEQKNLADESCYQAFEELTQYLGKHRMMGPQQPMLSYLRGIHMMEFFVKINRNTDDPSKIKQVIRQTLDKQTKKHKKLRIAIDVDPA